ncbi:hypothetical protein SAY86_028043 [Trapa natans]|uniref:Plus3 domain-containing protein n=1 Tax=Trapa natans TaxID=22666 RepID=A0AAN7M0C5_TRANT|nr:hypothetical protein SAY86_028043 [Trapa natans]
MADLENLLLEAAGRTNASGRNRQSFPQSKRRREGSFDDHGSDSREDDSDGGRGYPGRKPSGSQVPLKKRFESTERDDDEGSLEGDEEYGDMSHGVGSSDESDVGSDLYKDEDDRQKLAQMTELQREMILEHRASKKGDKEFKDTLRSKKRENEKATQSRKEATPSTARIRSSSRATDRAAAKDDALNELRAKRLKQQHPESDRRLRDASKGTSGAQDFSSIKRKAFAAPDSKRSAHSDSDSRSDSEDDAYTGDGGLIDSDDERGLSGSDRLKFEDIKEITVRRSKLAKWLMEPFFEELIIGCFVRVGIGMTKSKQRVYRLCIVRNVDGSDPNRQYNLDNKMTHKYLNLVWGNESSAARWQMAMVSDSPPLEEEFNQWVREVDRTSGRMPTKHDVLEKKEAIKKINTYVYSAETVKQMLKEKKSASTRPLNIAAEKDRLRRELEIAQYKDDEVEIERINDRLKQLEASRQAQRTDAKAIRLAEMNRKNRVENFKNASDLKRVNTELKAGEAGYDPFSRRWTRSRNYYVSKPNNQEEAVDGGSSEIANGRSVAATDMGAVAGAGAGAAGVGMTATAKALEAAAGAGKLVDTRAPVDKGTESNLLHNFEIPISLNALQKFGGPHGALAGFMARKQKIEATVGCRVPKDDVVWHTKTLTISDYKRRRGLI